MVRAPHSGLQFTHEEKLKYSLNYVNCLFGGKIGLPSVVVAGTKGKGSTCSVIESVLRHNGFKTGLFTSPHLVSPRERIKINGKSINGEMYVSIYQELEKCLKGCSLKMPPFFGVQTLMAAMAFTSNPIDVAVIECGIGGRFDWTQVFSPSVSVVTHLEYDHVELLGRTADSIAWHKAGVFKPNIPALSPIQNHEFFVPLQKYSKQQGANLRIVEPYYQGEMGLRGPTAMENTSLGIEASIEIGKIFQKEIDPTQGARTVDILGRYQTVFKDNINWMLDGAHSKESLLSCYRWYTQNRKNSSSDVLLCAMTKSRDSETLLSPFFSLPFKEKIFVKSYGLMPGSNLKISNNLKESISYAKSLNPHSVLVTGSLHLVGDTMRRLKIDIP